MTPPPPPPSPNQAPRYACLTAALLAAGTTIFLLHTYSAWPREAILMAGIFVLAAILWATETLPLFATALLVIGLEIILLANPGGWPGLGFSGSPSPDYQKVIHAAADPILLLFFGGFLLAQAAAKEGVDQAVSSLLLAPFGKNAKTLLLGVLCVTATFSMWMSNTATAAMMIALVLPSSPGSPQATLSARPSSSPSPSGRTSGGWAHRLPRRQMPSPPGFCGRPAIR